MSLSAGHLPTARAPDSSAGRGMRARAGRPQGVVEGWGAAAKGLLALVDGSGLGPGRERDAAGSATPW